MNAVESLAAEFRIFSKLKKRYRVIPIGERHEIEVTFRPTHYGICEGFVRFEFGTILRHLQLRLIISFYK